MPATDPTSRGQTDPDSMLPHSFEIETVKALRFPKQIHKLFELGSIISRCQPALVHQRGIGGFH
jgi:hypothetical protein